MRICYTLLLYVTDSVKCSTSTTSECHKIRFCSPPSTIQSRTCHFFYVNNKHTKIDLVYSLLTGAKDFTIESSFVSQDLSFHFTLLNGRSLIAFSHRVYMHLCILLIQVHFVGFFFFVLNTGIQDI